MHRGCAVGLFASLILAWWSADAALAQPSDLRIEWDVKNRFRLFRSEADFERHVAAYRNDGVLGAEQRLAVETDGRGWAQDVVERLCVDHAGNLIQVCERILDAAFPADFARLRAALVVGNLANVVLVSYGHPALADAETICPGGRDGFDVHPAFRRTASACARAQISSRGSFSPGSRRWLSARAAPVAMRRANG
jgi:hypothetical protein